MRINGHWQISSGGGERPVIEAAVLTASGAWRPVTFLLDSAADRTVFEASFQPALSPLTQPDAEGPTCSGIGGSAGGSFVATIIAFSRDDGQRVIVRGPFGVFADPASTDTSILGRDVADNFDVI